MPGDRQQSRLTRIRLPSPGLSLIRQKRPAEAMQAPEAAERHAPAVPRQAYIRAVALHDCGEPEQASRLLRDTPGRHPFDRPVLTALATYAAEAGDADAAQEYVERLRELDPDSPAHRQLDAMFDGMD